MPEWREIEMGESRAVRLAGVGEYGNRLRVMWTEFDTTREDELAALRDFVMRPLVSLVGRDEDDRYYVPGLAIKGVDPHWRIVTTIHNHHLGLNPRLTLTMATVSDDDETVYLSVTKQTDGAGRG